MTQEVTAPATFFDGRTSARHEVSVVLAGELRIADAAGGILRRWPLHSLRRQDSPTGMLRLACVETDAAARLEIRDAEMIEAVRRACPGLDKGYRAAGAIYMKIVGWSLAAVISLSAVAFFGIPRLAAAIAPAVPMSWERQLGAAVDEYIRNLLRQNDRAAFACETDPGLAGERAILDRLVTTLQARSGTEAEIEVSIVKQPQANAVALPGGRIYIFSELLKRIDSADELAAVIAHEMGHVVHRDSLKSLIEAAGVSFIFGVVLGDFGGGFAVVLAAETLLTSSHSRKLETAADEFAVRLMNAAGRDATALATALDRIAPEEGGPVLDFVSTHPVTAERKQRIRRLARPQSAPPLVTPEEWRRLKSFCTS